MIGPYRIEGFAIVSADGMIADETGCMPLALQRDSDKRYFEDAMEKAQAAIHGRRSQEIHTNAPLRRRLVVSRSVQGVAPDPTNPRARLWNPAGASLTEALEALGVEGGMVAAIGGPDIYSLFLELGYDVFHLCRVADVRLPGGLRLFAPALFDGEPELCLAAAGLRAGPTVALGDRVTLTDWTRR
jgi:dihydrofolate reductase